LRGKYGAGHSALAEKENLRRFEALATYYRIIKRKIQGKYREMFGECLKKHLRSPQRSQKQRKTKAPLQKTTGGAFDLRIERGRQRDQEKMPPGVHLLPKRAIRGACRASAMEARPGFFDFLSRSAGHESAI